MLSFNIEPLVGALPIRFGMSRQEVHQLLGPPHSSREIRNGKGTSDYWNKSCINVGFHPDGTVKHIGFCPGEFSLSLNGLSLWTSKTHPDPNPRLLQLDPAPFETSGILVYYALGISTSGYHDGDANQLSLTVSPAGTWDKALDRAKKPDLSKYL